MAKHIYLFDIDGTLINAQGMGSQLFRRAMTEVLDFEPRWTALDFAGQTDAGLFRRALGEAGLGENQAIYGRFFERYHTYLENSFREQPAAVLPGVAALLRKLGEDSDARLALLTGNTRRGSELKLAGLFSLFEFGIFGEQHSDRSDLGREARRYADATYGRDIPLTIIGDTPNDITCARAAGATAIAVGTGHFGQAELSHADRFFADLTEWNLV